MQKKEKYELLWKDTIIGRVYVNENEEYIYTPDIRNITNCSKDGLPASLVIKPQEQWSKELPKFIKRRLEINPKGNHKVVTDFFSIIEK